MTRRAGVPLLALTLALVALVSACGGSPEAEVEPIQETPDVADIPDWVATKISGAGGFPGVLFATSDHAVGTNRVAFVVVRSDNTIVQAPKATVHFGLRTSTQPVEAQAALKPLGPHSHPGRSALEPHDHPDATDIYVAHVRFPSPGKYWFVIEPSDSSTPGAGVVEVAKNEVTPAVGTRAIASENPTLARMPATKITTARPPDLELLRHSVADSLRARVPFVVAFATPAYCQTRACGPVVEVVDKVRALFAGSRLRFIHIEVYEGNRPRNGVNRWMREWRLPTEPWVFVVDRGGVIRAKFEGAVSVEELAAAVRAHLL